MENRPGPLLHQLKLAHFNACLAGLAAEGLRNVGSPWLLFHLSRCPDGPDTAPTQRELAAQLHTSPATIAASLKSLERAGYVLRRTDRRDARRNRIFITEQGRDVVRTSLAVFQRVDEQMYAGFSPEEREQALQLQHRMLDNLYQIGGDKNFCPPPPPPPPLPNSPKGYDPL